MSRLERDAPVRERSGDGEAGPGSLLGSGGTPAIGEMSPRGEAAAGLDSAPRRVVAERPPTRSLRRRPVAGLERALHGRASPFRPGDRGVGLRGRLQRKRACLFLGNRQVTCLNSRTPLAGALRRVTRCFVTRCLAPRGRPRLDREGGAGPRGPARISAPRERRRPGRGAPGARPSLASTSRRRGLSRNVRPSGASAGGPSLERSRAPGGPAPALKMLQPFQLL